MEEALRRIAELEAQMSQQRNLNALWLSQNTVANQNTFNPTATPTKTIAPTTPTVAPTLEPSMAPTLTAVPTFKDSFVANMNAFGHYSPKFPKSSDTAKNQLSFYTFNNGAFTNRQDDDQTFNDDNFQNVKTGTGAIGGLAMAAFNSGDTAWMLCATALVLFMTMPGLAIYYAGMVREKNVLAIIMQIFTICSLVTFLWLCFGYSLSFAPAYPNHGTMEVFGSGARRVDGQLNTKGADRLWLRGMQLDSFHYLAPTIPESVFCTYQLTFAIITAALICGSFADRIKFLPMIIMMAFWHLVVYCPMAHSNWHPQGFLKMIGVMDYAGGNVVHICSGVSGLATIMVVGNRKGFGKETFKPSSIMITFIGMCMLWVGWIGFNAGSAVTAGYNAGYAMLATQISTSVASLTWMLTEWAIRKKPSVLGMISGAVAGLVCITPASGYVDMTGAFFIGFFGGPLCYFGAQLKHWLGFDDALDAFGVHAVGGIVGGIATGFFATTEVNRLGLSSYIGMPKGTQGDGGCPGAWAEWSGTNCPNGSGVYYAGLHRGGMQLAVQLCGILFAIGWPFAWTFVICKILDLTIGLRVSEEAEDEGLDSSIHGETVNDLEPEKKKAAAPSFDTEIGMVGVPGRSP